MIRKGLFRLIRLAQLGTVVVAGAAAVLLRHKAEAAQIRLDGLNRGLDIRPIADIPWPRLDLQQCEDPIATILAAPEFEAATAFFIDNPAASRSLVSASAQALLYALVRNQRPNHVFEIGTYKAGTTEAVCRALQANGCGIVHTVDPFRGEYVTATLKHWPASLLKHIRFYPLDSMAFYKEKERQHVNPDLVFVDGNHDYEFALFDISRGARYLTRGGSSMPFNRMGRAA